MRRDHIDLRRRGAEAQFEPTCAIAALRLVALKQSGSLISVCFWLPGLPL